jgi:hypothetical protein
MPKGLFHDCYLTTNSDPAHGIFDRFNDLITSSSSCIFGTSLDIESSKAHPNYPAIQLSY